MVQTVPIYRYACGGRSVTFSPDGDLWITDISGDDGLDVSIHETQSAGQIGATRTGAAVGSRDVTVTGVILADLDTNERLLKQTVRPLAAARLYKLVNGETWYLEGEPRRTPDVGNRRGLLPFQFKFHAYFPFWRTGDTLNTLLGGLQPTWFPTPVHTSGAWYISRRKQSLYTSIQNAGNSDAELVITLEADARVRNPMVYHLGSDSYIKLNAEMLPGEKAEVRTTSGARGCTYYAADGTAQNGFRLLDIQSDLQMVLVPGENLLRLTADTGRENLTCRVLAPKGVASGV